MDSQGSIKNTLIAQLFQQNYDWLCKKLSYQTGCSHSAEDLAAEAFLQVWMLPDPASIRSPRAFLATIAQRLMYESWRRKDLSAPTCRSSPRRRRRCSRRLTSSGC